MIVVMKAGSSKAQLDEVLSHIEQLGYRSHVMVGVERTVIGCLGDERGHSQIHSLGLHPGVESVMPILKPYKLAAREMRREATSIAVGPGAIAGGDHLLVIAGPCSVESEEQIVGVARAVKAAGAHALRGGAFKPRSSTYSFQGLGKRGLELLRIAKQETGLPIVTEIMDHQLLDLMIEYADVLQIGARNMQNFVLLREVGKVHKPVLLKRGLMCTVDELLMSAEYILAEGNPHVILCERGIRTFETATRNTLDLNAIPAIQERSHLPVIVDPSHGTGVSHYVSPMSKAAIACGASGLIIEVHPNPGEAMSDGSQSLTLDAFSAMMSELKPLAAACGKIM